jgi:adenosylcobinamide kinase / adenosylcobinamide-phosphate guanylyltransferase
MTYQLDLNPAGRLAVVVGGGAVAGREAGQLLAAGASVLVVADELSAPLAELAARGQVAVRRGRYQAADLNGGWLAVACADQPAVNAAVAVDAERRRLWCVTPDDAATGSANNAPSRILVLGGARSGKSSTAERFLAGRDAVEYVATGMPPGDDDAEWAARVAEHRARRPGHWRTSETLDLEGVLTAADPAPVLVDCLSLWLARVMDECGAWEDSTGAAAVDKRISGLLIAWRGTTRPVIAVSNEVGSGVVPATASGRLYRDVLGRLNAAVAAECDEVWLCTAGLPRRLK